MAAGLHPSSPQRKSMCSACSRPKTRKNRKMGLNPWSHIDLIAAMTTNTPNTVRIIAIVFPLTADSVGSEKGSFPKKQPPNRYLLCLHLRAGVVVFWNMVEEKR
jgi:hypothetical protein